MEKLKEKEAALEGDHFAKRATAPLIWGERTTEQVATRTKNFKAKKHFRYVRFKELREIEKDINRRSKNISKTYNSLIKERKRTLCCGDFGGGYCFMGSIGFRG